VAYINQGAMRLLGVQAKDVPTTVRDLLSRWPFRSADGRAIPAEQRVTARALRGEAVHRFEGVLRRPNGEDLVVAISAAPIRDEQTGNVRMAVLVLHDISEMKRLERLREDFVATAAHELKTPIAGIKGYAQRLLRWAPERPDSREARASTVIVRQCDRLNRLVQELLEFSHQPFAMQEQLLRERFVLGELVSDVLERMHAPPKYRLVVRRDQPAGVLADRDRIEQVLVNLLDNAIRYMPQGGEVAVSVGSREGKATVAVEDHGIGIPKERQARIFTPFFRPHAGTPYRFAAGLGIGLFISREIVARHGGRMWFSSEEGKGSQFCFSLPLASEGANGSQS
jgi:PAS domain S-box-containing protein